MNLNHLPGTPLPRPACSNPLHRGARVRIWGAASTMLVATLAALSVTLLGACGGGEAGDETASAAAEPQAPTARKATVDFALESEFGPGDAPGTTTRGSAGPATATAATTAAAATAVAGVEVSAAEREDRSAIPVDRQAHTRRGSYVSRAVAERAYVESGGHAVWVDASCCAGLDPELPERIAFGMQAVLGDEAPLYVSGNDLRQAARLADRLGALGVRRVYLVTP